MDCILVARDREGLTSDTVNGRGDLTAALLDYDLLLSLNRQALLVSDSQAAYRAFARKHGIAHETGNAHAGVHVRRLGNLAIHVQNVNAYHQRIKACQRFRGVASSYLTNYLGWRRVPGAGW